MSATITGDSVSEVMSHAAPTSCIQVPMLEVSEAIQSARNTSLRNGAQADALFDRESEHLQIAYLAPATDSREQNLPNFRQVTKYWRYPGQVILDFFEKAPKRPGYGTQQHKLFLMPAAS